MLISVLKDIFLAFYQAFFFASSFAYFAMYFYLLSFSSYTGGKGMRNSIRIWNRTFKRSQVFRWLYIDIFFIVIVIFKTLLNREVTNNPLSDVLGRWWIVIENLETGETIYNNDMIENFVMLMPFSYINIGVLTSVGYNLKFKQMAAFSIASAFSFSMLIETAQLIFHLGTFQLSDLFFNTFGSLFGGVMFYLWSRLKMNNKGH